MRLSLARFDRTGLPDQSVDKILAVNVAYFWTDGPRVLEELRRERPDLLAEIAVLDFNPVVHEKLVQRKIHARYGDITAREVLHHAGVTHAQVIICSLPNTVL